MILKYQFALLYLTLPVGWIPNLSRHPELRPQHGPNVQLRQTSKAIESLGSWGKLQQEEPVMLLKLSNTYHWARLLLGWVTAHGQVNHLGNNQPSRFTQPSTLCGMVK